MTNYSPTIGITTYGVNANGEFSLPQPYVRAVRRAGGIPVLLVPGEPQIDAVVERLDGLILAGGGDIDPARYGGAMHDTIYSLDAERDDSELSLVNAALTERLPILAICRGLQVLNVALGGTLHPHLPDAYGETILHRAPPRAPTPHTVTLVGESALAGRLQSTEITCQSWHHQAIDRLGQGLIVMARAADQVVEGVELEGYPELVAVQWHPELSAADDPQQQSLFATLVEWATARRRKMARIEIPACQRR